MKVASVKNIIVNACSPGFFAVMAEKLWRRVSEAEPRSEAREARLWCAQVAEDVEAFAQSLDAQIWNESTAYAERLESHSKLKLEPLGLDLGGGGDYRLLYFLVRLRQPATVVETGVAAGYSSHAILTALRHNARGRLLSSDFPYFRLHRPEQYVGYLVDDDLREDWELHLLGDRKNLPVIARNAKSIDLVHYDSDKSRAGRKYAMGVLLPALSKSGLVVMDDIGDNLFFRDLAVSQNRSYRVFEFNGKHLGLIGL